MPFLDKVLPLIDRVDRDRLAGILKALVHERDLLEKVFNLLGEGIVVADQRGKVTFANRAADSILLAGRGTLSGAILAEALADAGLRALVAEALRSRHGILAREMTVERPFPEHLSATVVPIEDAEGRFDGAVFIFRVTTADLRKQERRAQLKRMQAFAFMAAGIAHEIGNPLNALDIHLQLIERRTRLLKGAGKKELVELLDVAKEEVKRLDGIVGKFLKAARTEEPPSFAEADLAAILDRTLDFMEPEMRRAGISVERRHAPFVPPVLCDADRIRQVFINLLRNAAQATPRGGSIKVGTGVERGQVTVSVADSGCGIPDDHLARIFEPYFTTKDGGSGLGLVIVERIVAEHGGDLIISSTPGEGTTIAVRIPVPARYGKLLPGGGEGGKG
jgi:signal transduction histidine kinase